MNEREIYLSFGTLCDKILQGTYAEEDVYEALKDVANSIGMRFNLLDELTTAYREGENDSDYYSVSYGYTDDRYSLYADIAADVKKNPWKYPEKRTA